jgi:hypothetical protein
MMDQVYFSKIKQSLQFNDLAGYRTNAENLKDALKKSQSDLWQRQTQLNIRDADMEPFNNAQSAASDLIGSYLSVAVDIAVNANTGMDSPPDDAQDVSAVKASERKFRSAALSGYDHFGVKRSDIDMDFRPRVLMLKLDGSAWLHPNLIANQRTRTCAIWALSVRKVARH